MSKQQSKTKKIENCFFGHGMCGMSADLGEHKNEKIPRPQAAKQMSANFRNIPWKLREPLLAILPPSNLAGRLQETLRHE